MAGRLKRTRNPSTPTGIMRTMAAVVATWSVSELALTLARQLLAATRGPADQVGFTVVDWIRQNVRYTHEEPEVIVGLGPLLELGAGDCDDMAAAVASLLLPLGWQVLWAIGWRGAEPVHVWALGRPPGRGSWQHLDPSITLPAGSSPEELGDLTGSTVHYLDGRGVTR